MKTKTRLDLLLGAYYGAVIVRKESGEEEKKDIQKAVRNEATLKEAQEKLAQLEPVPEKRCFISSIHKRILKEVLHAEG